MCVEEYILFIAYGLFFAYVTTVSRIIISLNNYLLLPSDIDAAWGWSPVNFRTITISKLGLHI
jgi:hypothetical protein